MGMKNELSVVIPSFNGRELLAEYLPATFEVCRNSGLVDAFEVVVADDASTDGTVGFLRERFPEVVVVEGTENGGFSKNTNRGIRAAKYDWILLLNNDMELLEGTVDGLMELRGAEVFGVSCAICSPQDGGVQEGRKLPVVSGHKISYRDDTEVCEVCDTMYLCGGVALINRVKVAELGGFDEVYSPFYFEDMDLSLRAWQRGWRCLYTPNARCLHQHSVTINNNFDREYVKSIFVRNRTLLAYRFVPCAPRLLLNLMFHVAIEHRRKDRYCPYGDALRMIRDGKMKRMPMNRRLLKRF